ncbi:MAG TPA: site-2 protease family protein [bacterium]|nr:site-2 protease family protein [bacterium]
MNPLETDNLTRLVTRVLKIEEVTHGDQKQGFLMRYSGQLRTGDSAAAYDQLASVVRPLNITPLFRKDQDRHVVVLMSGVVNPQRSKVWVNIVLFIATIFSVMFAGTLYTYDGPVSANPMELLGNLLGSLDRGLSFAVSILAILLAHEFGHYLAGRYHHVHVTLPYFIPFPFSPFGTMGAFIQLKEPPKNKRILLDIGIAGPLAGLLVAIPVLLVGLYLSAVDRIPLVLPPGQGIQMEGNSILYLASKYIVFGKLLPTPSSYGGLSPVLYWVRYFFTGQPFPWGGTDVMLHPVAWAGWAGLLVTALNLIPAGQLDGGHIMYVLLGNRAKYLLPIILGVLALLGLVWTGWWLWAFLIYILGRLHAEPLDQITPLDPHRRVLAVSGLLIFILVFTPVPLLAFGGF